VGELTCENHLINKCCDIKPSSLRQAAAAQVKTEKLTADLESAKEEMSNLVPRSELVHTLPGHERERERARARERARHRQSGRKLERKSAHEKDRKRERQIGKQRELPNFRPLPPNSKSEIPNPFAQTAEQSGAGAGRRSEHRG